MICQRCKSEGIESQMRECGFVRKRKYTYKEYACVTCKDVVLGDEGVENPDG